MTEITRNIEDGLALLKESLEKVRKGVDTIEQAAVDSFRLNGLTEEGYDCIKMTLGLVMGAEVVLEHAIPTIEKFLEAINPNLTTNFKS